MPNTHTSHKHGLHTMNSDRPKSKMWKRRNKAKAKVRKEVLLQALADACNPGEKAVKVAPKKTAAAKRAPAKKTEPKRKKEIKEPPKETQEKLL